MAMKGDGPVKLPRSHSTPSSRHWLFPPDAAGTAAGSRLGSTLPGIWPSTGSSRRAKPTRFSGASVSRCSSFGAGPQPYHTGRQRAKTDLLNAMATRGEEAQLRRLRQVVNANQWNHEMNGEARKVDARISELSHLQASKPAFSEIAERALLGIERPRFYEFGEATEAKEPAQAKVVSREASSNSKKPVKQMSLPSTEAVQHLGQLDVHLVVIENRVTELDQLVRGLDCLTAEALGQMKTELAQLEAEANKLETKGVDSVYTSELGSGQALAKQLKKAQIRRLETLFALIEQLFRVLSTKG